MFDLVIPQMIFSDALDIIVFFFLSFILLLFLVHIHMDFVQRKKLNIQKYSPHMHTYIHTNIHDFLSRLHRDNN